MDENFVVEYRFLIDQSATEIITKLNEVKEAVANRQLKSIEWGPSARFVSASTFTSRSFTSTATSLKSAPFP